jgi:glycosyltransferase involved in cell wall biosynthesis
MKVLQILPELNAGGVERGTLEIARFLVQQGHESLVVSNGGRLVPELEAAGTRHISMPVHRKRLSSLLQVRPFRRLLEKERPDIVHIRSRAPGWIAWLAWRRMDPRTRPRLVSTVHGFNSVNPYSVIMTRGERVIAVSGAVRDHVLRNYPQVPPDCVRVIPRGIDPGEYPRGFAPAPQWQERWRKEFPQCVGRSLIVLPGRITRLKGHEDFFELVARLKQAGVPAHGLVVGDVHPKKQAYLAELRQRVRALGVQTDISFAGHRNDLREIMAVSDVVCSLSQQPEAFGRVVLEALALGRPVVGYDHGGVGEQLQQLFPEGRVPPGNGSALLETVQRILRERPVPGPVSPEFTLDVMCRATLDVYRELAN